MATIILNASSPATFTPNDGDIYILENDAQGSFTFLGDANFEVQLSESGPYGQGFFGNSAVNLNFEDDTSPTVTVGDNVNAGAVRFNANGDSLDISVGTGSTTGVIAGDGPNSFGDGLNPDGGGLTVNFADGSNVTNSIFGPTGLAPDGGADANYTFGNDISFTSAAQVIGSVGGSTDITIGNNASFGSGSGVSAPAGELNGDTQTITVGDNMTGGSVTVAGSNGEKTMIIGDNADIHTASFGSFGSNANPQFTADTGGTLIAGDNFNTSGWIYGAQTESTIIIGDGWNTQISLDGQNDNTALNADPVDTVRLGSPELFFDNSTGAVFGSGNDLLSVMPPEDNLIERGKWIGDAIASGWEENDDGSWSPTVLDGFASTDYSTFIYDTSYSGWAGAPAPLAEDPDGVVDGENDAEFMSEGYDDAAVGPTNSGGDIIDGADGDNDVILGNGGNDTIQAGLGTDEVYGGSGNDVIDGGAGNDTLTGDFASDVTDTVVDNSTVEGDDILEGGAGDDIIYGDSGNSLSAGGEGVPGTTLGDGPGSTGGYDNTRIDAQPVSDGNHSFSTDAFYLGNDIPILDGGDRDALVGVSFSQDGVGTDRTFGLDELEFTGAQRSFVGLVTVQKSSLSGATDQFSSSLSGGFQDVDVVSSGTADFTMNDGQVFEGVRINWVRGPDGETFMVPDDGPSPGAFNAFRNLLDDNQSGIASFTIATGSGADNGINPIEGNWGDGQFFENSDGDGGDDTIIGGTGADQMFGEGGDDTFIVGSAAEGAGDVISGGFGPDDTTDNDVLDLTGAGPVTINATADANDAGAQSGTVTFEDGSTLTFEGIETIIQDPDGPQPNQIVDGENIGEVMAPGYDDADGATNSGGDIIDGADGDNDVILGNGGNDTIDASAGTDEVYGGSGDDVIDGGAGNDTVTGDFASDVTDTVVDNSTVEGDDILAGGAGDDVIYGDSGNSLSAGGEGAGGSLGDGPGGTGAGSDRVVNQAEFNTFDFTTDAFFLGNDIVPLDDEDPSDPANPDNDALDGQTFSLTGTDRDGNPTDRTFELDELSFENGSQSFVGVIDIDRSDLSGSNSSFTSSYANGPQNLVIVNNAIVTFTMNDGQEFINIQMKTVRDDDGNTFMVPGDGASPTAFNSFRNLLDENDSGIASFEIQSISSGQNAIIVMGGDWADGQFADVSDGDGGDDTIIGGIGADTMFGEGGDDTFIVGSAAEGAGDVISGGFGPDENTDNDVLDLTGAGAVTINDAADANDAGATAGTVTFADGSTLEFEGIETILTDPAEVDPVANDDAVTIDEDAAPVTINVLANDTDPNGDPLTVIDATVPADQGTVAIVGNQVVFTPAPDFNGDATITYTIEDPDGNQDTAEVAVDVAPVDDAPVTQDDTATTDEDTPVTIDPLANDVDPDGQPLEILGTPTSPNGTVSVNPDGTIEFTPDPDFNGPTTIDYIAVDPDGNETPGQITVDVAPVNDAPDAINDVAETDEETPVTIDVLGNDVDVDGDPLTITAATVPADQGTVEVVNNALVFTPADDFFGEATISYSIDDGQGGTDVAEVAVTVNNINDAPTAVDDILETPEDTAITFDPAANDQDPDGDPLTVTDASVPADQGTVTVNPDGTVTFTPAPDYNGPAEITYTVDDGNGGTDEGVATVNVSSTLDPPVANDDTAETDEDTPVTIDVIGNDTDPDGDPLTITAATVPADQGTVEIVNNALVFTPAENFNGDATITYSVSDGNGGTDSADVAVTVTPVNDDPVAVDDIANGDEDTDIIVDLIGNDVDVDGDPLSLGAVSVDPALGTVVDNGDGTVTFTPAPDYNGPVTIDYTVVDGQGGEDAGQATVNVGAVNDAPIAEDDSDTTQEDTAVEIDLLANDSDPDGDALSVISATVDPAQGTLGPVVDGVVTFTPAPDFNGEATITYTISDGNGLTSTATHTVDVGAVDDAPVTQDDTATTDEDTPVTIDPLANDVDPDGQPLEILGTPTSPNGTVTVNPDGTIEFTPDPDFNGPTTIDYIAVDPDGNETPGQITVDVAPVDDAPVTQDDTATTDEDTPVTIDPLANDVDPDGQPLEILGTPTSPNGTVSVNPDGTIEFTPDPDFNGPTTIDYIAVDPDGNETPGQITVDVAPVNDAPDAINDVAETDEETPVTIDVLGNDVDVDGDPLTITAATVPADQGTVEVVNNALVFTPADDFFGEATISYSIDDGQGGTDVAEVAVTVNNINDAPTAVDDILETPEDTAITFDPAANDQDPDGDPLTVTDASVPADQGTVTVNPDGTVTFTPAPDYNGPAEITYTVDDGNGGTDEGVATVNVSSTLDPPVANDDTAETDEDTPVTIDVIGNDTDPDGDPLTITAATVPADQGTVEIVNNALVFTPAENFNGDATITYSVSDGNGGTDSADVAVTVTPVNDDPVAVDDIANGDEDTDIIVDLIGNDVDVDGDPLSLGAVSVDPALGTVVDNGDGTVTFTPAPDYNGPVTIDYTVVDGQGGEDAGQATVNVGAVNDAPIAEDDSDTTQEDTAVEIDLLANDSDPDGDALSVISATVDPAQGTLGPVVDGVVTFTPAPDFNGEATITYTISDGNGLTSTATHTVDVGAVDDAPVTQDDTATTDEDTPVTIDPLANDVDPDGQPLEILGTPTSPNGTVTVNPDGTIEFTPDPDFNGPTTIDYIAVDPDGNETPGQITVDVAPVDDAPVTQDDTATTDEDTPVTIDPLANDVDPDGQPLEILGTPTSPNGTVSVNPDGTIEFTPDPDFNGPTTIDYIAVDPDGNETPGQITVDVAPVNDAPDAINDVAETDEETPVTIDVLGNDVDVDGDPLTITAATVPADQGTVEVVNNALVFTPADDFFGEATISYSIDDGQGGTDVAEVAVTVNNINDAPTAVDDILETPEDTAITFDPAANDQDPDGDPLTVTDASVPADQGTVTVNPDGTVTFTPAPDYNGPAEITYTVDDGNGGTDEGVATVNVSSTLDPPVANDDTAETDEDTPVTIDVIGNDTDPDGDPLTITAATVPADQGTVEIVNNALVFTPAENFNGDATITYSVSDGNGGTDSADVAVTVTPVNDDPVAVDDIANGDEDTDIIVDLIGNDVDVDGDPLSLGAVSVDPALGTVVDNGDGTVTFTPAPDYNGPVTIDYTVVDGQGGEDAGQATVNVGAVNDAPIAEDDSDTTQEDTAVEIDLLANDSDPDGDALSVISATVDPAQGTLGPVVDGVVTFTPAPDFNGEATITYTISDGNGLTSTATHTVDVGAVDDAPVTQDDTATTDEDTPVTIDPLANDVDPDGQPLEILGTPTSPNGTVTVNPDGTIEFTPDPDFNGPTTIDYIAVDPDGNETPGQITVDVAPVDDAPVTQDDTATTDEDTPVTIDPLANDVDPDGQPLEILGTPTSPNGTVSVNPDGTIEFTPDPDFNGPTTIDYIAVDPDGNETPGQITVDVAPVNDAPDAVDDRAVTDFETPVTIDVLDNDTDPENDPVTITDATVPVAQGTVAIVGDELVFTPADGFEGVATITYTVSDGVLTGTADVVVTVGDNPADGVVDGAEDGEVMDPGYVDPQGDEIDGADGLDDTIEGNGGDDDIDAGLGDDDVSGGTGDDTIEGNVGNDTLAGNEGEDSIDGGDGDDVIDGGDDDDEIIGGDGSDSVLGGSGDDVIDTSGPSNPGAGIGLPDSGYPGVFPGDTDPDNDKDTVDGGDGNDVINTGDDADVITGGTGSDTIDGGIDNDTIDGGEDGDRIVGGEGADDILGGGGDDTIYAGNDPDLGLDIYNLEDDGTNPLGDDLNEDNGRDTVSGGEGNDLIFGADDDDLLMGDAGNDTIDGGIDDDTIMGGTGDDSLLGGQGNDSIEGGAGDDLIDGGIGNDSLLGGDDRDTFVNVNANDTVDGGEGGDDFDTLDLTGSSPAGGSLQVEFDPANNENGVVNYFDSDGNAVGTLEFSNIENVIPCFTPGTLIATAKGERLVEELQPGDRVITRDNGFQEIAWVGAKQMSGLELAQRPSLKPVFVKAGSLGAGFPERDMMLSPNHKVLLADDQAELYFEEREVFVAAKHLIGRPGIQQVDVTQTTYIHFMFESHEVVLSDGTWTESFHPGDYSINGIDEDARDEILALFPELATDEGLKDYRLARTELKRHEAGLLLK